MLSEQVCNCHGWMGQSATALPPSCCSFLLCSGASDQSVLFSFESGQSASEPLFQTVSHISAQRLAHNENMLLSPVHTHRGTVVSFTSVFYFHWQTLLHDISVNKQLLVCKNNACYNMLIRISYINMHSIPSLSSSYTSNQKVNYIT